MRLKLMIGLIAMAFGGIHPATASSVYTLPCVGGTSGCVAEETGTSSGDTVLAQGYFSASDQGGGSFTDIGLCDQDTYKANGATGAGNSTIAYNDTSGTNQPIVGSSIQTSAGGVFMAGTVITAVNSTTLTISIPTLATLTNFTILQIGSNNGTLVKSTGSGHHCYTKNDYRGEPHEWGVYANGTNDDGPGLHSWLGWTGPWKASIPATYMTNEPLTCSQGANIEAVANDAHYGDPVYPLVKITVGSGFPSTGTAGQYAVMSAGPRCRISGLAIDALYSGCSGSTNCYVDAVNVTGSATIDKHSLLTHGYWNVDCQAGSGAQLKDSAFNESFNNNIEIDCDNVRIIGDTVAYAGYVDSSVADSSAVGIYDTNEDMTVADGNIEQGEGVGVQLAGASQVSITGNFIEKNGNTTGGAGIEIDGGHTISICDNHFKENDEYTSSTDSGAHVRFALQDGTTSPLDVNLCGNVYNASNDGGLTYAVPNNVYDVVGSVGLGKITLYENPVCQRSHVFSSTAGGLAGQQLLPSNGSACATPAPSLRVERMSRK